MTDEILAIETRDQDTGNPAFSTVNYATGKSLITEKQYGDRNWSLAGMIGNSLILRAWGEQSPNGAGIACMDAITGDIRWEQFNYTLVGLENRQIVARHRNFASGYEQYLNPRTGNLTPLEDLTDSPTKPKIILPNHYLGETPAFFDRYHVIGDLVSCSINNRTVWAFHEALDNTYQIRLAVSQDSTLLADTVVATGLPKMTPELFF